MIDGKPLSIVINWDFPDEPPTDANGRHFLSEWR
jgi:hypothetical protein